MVLSLMETGGLCLPAAVNNELGLNREFKAIILEETYEDGGYKDLQINYSKQNYKYQRRKSWLWPNRKIHKD